MNRDHLQVVTDPDPVAEKQRIGRLLDTLEPGMTRAQVEAILGPPPGGVIKSTFEGEPLLFAVYPCSPPGLPPIGPGQVGHIMHVIYGSSGPVPIFQEVMGPALEGN